MTLRDDIVSGVFSDLSLGTVCRILRSGKLREHVVVECNQCRTHFPKLKSELQVYSQHYCSGLCCGRHRRELNRPIPGIKICTKCRQKKPYHDFYTRRKSADGLDTRCVDCVRDYSGREKTRAHSRAYNLTIKAKRSAASRALRTKYDLTLEEVEILADRQHYACALCGRTETKTDRTGNIRRLSVDHCHKTGRVRELLCIACNHGLGNFQDDTALLQKAIDYLTKHALMRQVEYKCPKHGVFEVTSLGGEPATYTICWKPSCCGRLCGEESVFVRVLE